LFTQGIAMATGVQIYTLAVAGLAIYQLRLTNDPADGREKAIAQFPG
jgi:hypothetical protein